MTYKLQQQGPHVKVVENHLSLLCLKLFITYHMEIKSHSFKMTNFYFERFLTEIIMNFIICLFKYLEI